MYRISLAETENSVIQVSRPNCNTEMPHRPFSEDPYIGSYRILQATKHAYNHVTVDLMLKSSILFISLDRNNDYKHLKKCQNLFLIFYLHLCNYFANISNSDCSTIVCLRILNTYIYMNI